MIHFYITSINIFRWFCETLERTVLRDEKTVRARRTLGVGEQLIKRVYAVLMFWKFIKFFEVRERDHPAWVLANDEAREIGALGHRLHEHGCLQLGRLAELFRPGRLDRAL